MLIVQPRDELRAKFGKQRITPIVANCKSLQGKIKDLERYGYEWILSVDPPKDAKADEVRLLSGVASRRSIGEEQGRDYEKLKREVEAEVGIRKVLVEKEPSANGSKEST